MRASLIRRFFSSFTKCLAPFCAPSTRLRLDGASLDPSALTIPSGSLATMLRLNGCSLIPLALLGNARYIFHLQIIYCIPELSRGEVTLGDKRAFLTGQNSELLDISAAARRPRRSCVKDD